MRHFFTFLKWIFIITTVFVIHAYITGNTHVFKTLGQTVLKGKLGPGVDTRKIFSTRKVNTGRPQPWQEDSLLGKLKLDKEYSETFAQYQTLAFLVTRKGKIIYEDYSQGYDKVSSTNPWSVSKSILSLLIGAAIQDGKIKSVNQNVSDFLPEYEGTGLKIWHLLSMSSGINFKEQYINPYGYPAKALYGTDLESLNSKYRVNNIPGKHFIYLSGNSQILGFVLKKAVGKNVSDYASEKLWRRIGAEYPAWWSLDKTGGMEKTFCCFHSNARDFAKIGQLMLQKGIWGNDTIFSWDYFNSLTHASNTVTLQGKPNDMYGFHWWVVKYKGLEIFYARGINGQYIIDIPAKDMVIVRLGRKWNPTKINGHHQEFYTYIDAALSLKE